MWLERTPAAGCRSFPRRARRPRRPQRGVGGDPAASRSSLSGALGFLSWVSVAIVRAAWDRPVPLRGSPLMANIASQKKRILRSDRERTENRLLTSTVKTYFRRLESAVEGGDTAVIEAEHRALVSRIDKAVQKGALAQATPVRARSQERLVSPLQRPPVVKPARPPRRAAPESMPARRHSPLPRGTRPLDPQGRSVPPANRQPRPSAACATSCLAA